MSLTSDQPFVARHTECFVELFVVCIVALIHCHALIFGVYVHILQVVLDLRQPFSSRTLLLGDLGFDLRNNPLDAVILLRDTRHKIVLYVLYKKRQLPQLIARVVIYLPVRRDLPRVLAHCYQYLRISIMQ